MASGPTTTAYEVWQYRNAFSKVNLLFTCWVFVWISAFLVRCSFFSGLCLGEPSCIVAEYSAKARFFKTAAMATKGRPNSQ